MHNSFFKNPFRTTWRTNSTTTVTKTPIQCYFKLSLWTSRAKPLKFHTNTSNPASQSWGKSGFKLSTHEITQRSQNKIKLLKPIKFLESTYTICFFCWYWWEGNEQDLHMQMDIVPILGQLGSNVRQQTNKREQHSWRHTWCAVFSNHMNYKHTCWVSNCAWQNIYIAQIGQLRKHISCDQINIQWGKNERVAFIIKNMKCVASFCIFQRLNIEQRPNGRQLTPSSLSKTELVETNIIQQILCKSNCSHDFNLSKDLFIKRKYSNLLCLLNRKGAF